MPIDGQPLLEVFFPIAEEERANLFIKRAREGGWCLTHCEERWELFEGVLSYGIRYQFTPVSL